jgi:hypothetical protein
MLYLNRLLLGSVVDVLLLGSAAAIVPSARLEGVLLLVFGSPSCCFHCMLVCFALWLMHVQRSLFLLTLGRSRELVPFIFSASLSCFWFVQGSLFPLPPVQQASLAFDLVKGFCSLFLVLLVSSSF